MDLKDLLQYQNEVKHSSLAKSRRASIHNKMSNYSQQKKAFLNYNKKRKSM